MEGLHRAALAAADPAAAVARHLRLAGHRLSVGDEEILLSAPARVWLIGLGKACAAMARPALRILGGRLAGGVLAHPASLPPEGPWPAGLQLVPAGHPLPDQGSLAAGEAALDLLRGVAGEDVVLVLVSGGGSALMEALRPGLDLADLQSVTRALQHAGADIAELNTVRRALSRLKGGGLARHARPARVAALLLSDVVGDPPAAIASGPTVASPTGPLEALGVLRRHGLPGTHPNLVRALEEAAREEGAQAAPSGPIAIVGSNRVSAEAAGREAEERGFRVLSLGQRLQGEAREVGRLLGGIARSVRESSLPLPPPACLVLGGETTVTVRGHGRGGRNQEMALGAALALEGCARTAVFCFATDGVDGASEAAGAVATGETLERARALGLSPHAALADNDSEPFFRALEDLWISGPTGTNVNDLALALVYP